MERVLSCAACLGLMMAATITGAGDRTDAARQLLRDGWQIQSSAELKVGGETISTAAFRPDGWHRARVPTTVVAALVADGTLADPHFGMNVRSYPGVSYPIGENFSNLPMPADSPFAVPWWFRKEFTLGATPPAGRVWLRFDGINYAGDIWLNGRRIAQAHDLAGAMRTHELEVTGQVVPNGRNVLAVSVVAPKPDELAITFVDWNPLPPDRLMGLYRDVTVVTSGPVTVRDPLVVTRLEKAGLKYLARWEYGFRTYTTSKRQINTPDDFKGLKIRTPPDFVNQETVKALGGIAQTIAFTELAMALKQGVVDGQENPIATIYSNKMWETQKYLSMLNYTYNSTHLLMGKAAFDRLTPAQQQILIEEGKKAGLAMQKSVRDMEATQIAELKKNGMEVAYPDTAPFKTAAMPVYNSLKAQLGESVFTTFMQLLDKAK